PSRVVAAHRVPRGRVERGKRQAVDVVQDALLVRRGDIPDVGIDDRPRFLDRVRRGSERGRSGERERYERDRSNDDARLHDAPPSGRLIYIYSAVEAQSTHAAPAPANHTPNDR